MCQPSRVVMEQQTHRGRYRYTLRLALVGYLIGPLLAATVISSGLGLRALESKVEQRMQEDIGLVARAIRTPLTHALRRGRDGSVNAALTSALEIGRVYGAYVYDVEGRTVAAFGVQDHRRHERRFSRLAVRGEQGGEYAEIAGRQVYSYFLPLSDVDGRILGLLQVVRRRADFRDYITALRWWTAGSLLMAALAMTGLVLYGHNRAVGMHLKRLAMSMRHVGQGDRRHRETADGPLEIAELGTALNEMLDSIERAECEVEERRAMQAALEDRLRQTEKLAVVGQLTAGVAHELGAPLSVISGRAQHGLREPGLSARLQQIFATIRAEVTRMERTVGQLLDFGRTNAIRRRPADPAHLVRMAAATVREEASRAGVRFEVDGGGGGPVLTVDTFRVSQALANLLRNAVQASPGGRVRVSWSGGRNEVAFVVEDDGPGVSPEIRSRIFEPFFTTKGALGTGLGLAVVQRVAHEHGGAVFAGDSERGGAAFRLILPTDEADGRA